MTDKSSETKPLNDKDLEGVSGGIIIQTDTRTAVDAFLPGTARGFDPQPDPPVAGVENPTTR
jgi:hypothetical protein